MPTPSSSTTASVLSAAGEDADADGGDGRRDHDDGRLARVRRRSARAGASRPRGPPRSAALAWRAAPAATLASSVITVPSASETRTVRGANDHAGLRQVAAERDGQQPLASPSPAKSPIDRGEQADHQALDHDRAHDLPARGAERPQRRELARALGDGDRQGVEDHERADEQRDRAEAEQEVADDVHDDVGVLGVRRGLLLGVLDLQARGDERLRRRGPARPATCPAWRRSRCRRSGPACAAALWAVGRSQIAIVAPPSESTVAEGGDAGHLVAALGSERGHGDACRRP